MAHWNDNYFGIILENKELLSYAKQIFDCWGINYGQSFFLHGEGGLSSFGENWDLFGTGRKYLYSTYGLLNKLFGNIKACEVEDVGNTITDGLAYESCMYDSSKNMAYLKSVYYDQGAGTVGECGKEPHDLLTWEELKDKIEEEVERVNKSIAERGLQYPSINIAWIDGEAGIEPDPDNEDFVEVCDDVFWSEFSYDDYGTNTSEDDISEDDMRIDQEELDELIKLASEKGYSDLVNFIHKRIESTESDIVDGKFDSEACEAGDEKMDFSGSVVVSTGLSLKDEAWVKEQVEERGGIFKEKFVKSLTVLVINPDYDHETTKLKNTKELIAEGKNARIITFEEFKKLL